MLRTANLDQVPLQRWRNGGGSTQELLAWPTADDWLFRISVAQIERDGPFSMFAEIDRWFAVVRGDGVTLRFPSGHVALRRGDEPLHFDGAAAPICDLLSGATQDLNLMVQRGRGRGAMRCAKAGEALHSMSSLRAVFTAEAATLHTGDRGDVVLPANTLAFSDDAAGQRWHVTALGAPLCAWWIEVEPNVATA